MWRCKLQIARLPTMKSLDGVNKKNDVNNTASEAPEKNVKTESEKIDFSKVKEIGRASCRERV